MRFRSGLKTPRGRAGLLAFATILVLIACSTDALPPISVTELKISAPNPGATMSAGYMQVTNNTDTAIDITSVTSPQFGKVEMHETLIENNIARMRPVPALRIDAGATVTFTRGGKHLMLMHPIGEPAAVTIALYSDDALLISVDTTLHK